MKEITIKLTRPQFEVITDHMERDLRWGTEGTFGDGENLYTAEVRIAYNALKRMYKQALTQ